VNDTGLTSITEEYLGRLDAASWRLPGDRRAELVAEVRAHISAAMLAGPGDEAALRTVLDNLGAPEEIAREALEQEALPQQPPAPASSSTTLRDISTILLLMFGGFLFVVGWFVGVALLWTSPRWSNRDKWLATLIWPFGYLGPALLGTVGLFGAASETVCTSSAVRAGAQAHETCTGGGGPPGWVAFVIFLAVLVAPIAVSAHLLRSRAENG
jgi:hypothetical protein